MESLNTQTDQAQTLRTMQEHLSEGQTITPADAPRTRVLSVTSGKGGVGKTAVTSNVAVALARQGKRVLIIDADLGLANIDVVFGLAPQYNLNHFFSGEKTLSEIMVEGPEGVKILPAGSGMQKFTHLSGDQKMKFLEELDAFHDDFDLVLIDTEAGISENVIYFNVAAHDILVVTNPEPTAITDAYALMKVLSTQHHERRFQLVVNSINDEDEALDVYRKLVTVANRYLDISLDYLGCIPLDRRMREAIRRQRVIVDLYPRGKTSKSFASLAEQLVHPTLPVSPKGNVQIFWRRLLDFGQEQSA